MRTSRFRHEDAITAALCDVIDSSNDIEREPASSSTSSSWHYFRPAFPSPAIDTGTSARPTCRDAAFSAVCHPVEDTRQTQQALASVQTVWKSQPPSPMVLPNDSTSQGRELTSGSGSFEAQLAQRRILESENAVASYVTSSAFHAEVSLDESVSAISLLLPRNNCSVEAALLLIRGLVRQYHQQRGDWLVEYAGRLYLRIANAPSQTALARKILPGLISCRSLPQAMLASLVITDVRLKPSQVLHRLSRCVKTLEGLVHSLVEKGHGRRARDAQRGALLETWRHALETLNSQGVFSRIDETASMANTRAGSSLDRLLAEAIVMIARWGPVSSVCALSSALKDRPGVTETYAEPFRTGRDQHDAVSISDIIIKALLKRGAVQQAAVFFSALPSSTRKIATYAALLEHFGEADLSWSPREHLSSLRNSAPPSIAFQRQLWEDAVGAARSLPHPHRAPSLRRLFEARLISHAKHKTPRYVWFDLEQMQRLNLLNVSSSAEFSSKLPKAVVELTHAAQVAIVQSHARAGQIDQAKTLALDIAAHWKACESPQGAPMGLLLALFNTLLASTAKQLVEAVRAVCDAGQSLQTDPEVIVTRMLNLYDEFGQALAVRPNGITRNIMLLTLCRVSSSQSEEARRIVIKELLQRAGIFDGMDFAEEPPEHQARPDDKGFDLESERAALMFLRHGKSGLRGVINILFEQGKNAQAREVVDMLKTAELWAHRWKKQRRFSHRAERALRAVSARE